MSPSAADVTVNRGCCEVKDDSLICPLGPDFQIDQTVDWTRYMSRCETDLCNDSEGDEVRAAGTAEAAALFSPAIPAVQIESYRAE